MVTIFLTLFFGFFLYGLYFIFIKTPIEGVKTFMEYKINKKAAQDYYESKQKIIEELEKNNYLQTKQIQQKIIDQDKQSKRNAEILKRQNEIATAAINKTNQLRAKYPFANEDLFNLYSLRFVVATMDELNELENTIRQSNELNYKVSDTSIKNYTLKDLDGLTPIEHIKEDPIILKLFKIDINDYVIYVRDIDTGDIQLLNSNDYIIVVKTMNMIKEKQKSLSIRKEKISAKEITNIYDNVSVAIQKLRESGTMTI